jgi:Ca2+-binding RTX toxin-like protein
MRALADLTNIENLLGTDFDDVLVGSPNAGNHLDGGAGNDALYANGGFDTLEGGSGTDTADFSPFGAAVLVSLNASGVEAYTQDGPTLSGGTFRELADLSGIEYLVGSNFDDLLAGTAALNNRLDGAGGNDLLYVHGGLDALDGGTGTDTADFSTFGSAVLVSLNASEYEAWTTDAATLGSGVLRPLADVSNMEKIVGTSEADELYGNGAVNEFDGGAGDDLLVGRGGADRLTGGAGADRFDCDEAGAGVDIVTDFTRGSGNDVLDIRDMLLGQTVNSGNIAAYVQLGPEGQASTMVSVDVNGATGGSIFVDLAIFEGVTGLVLNDMLTQGNLLV